MITDVVPTYLLTFFGLRQPVVDGLRVVRKLFDRSFLLIYPHEDRLILVLTDV